MSDSDSTADSVATPPPKKRSRQKMATPHQKMAITPDIQRTRPTTPKPVFLSQAKWSNFEKRHLLRALRTCMCEEDVSKVYTMVPTRKREEVEAEILRLRNSVVQHGPDLKAPIETWLDFAEEMVHYEEDDLSRCLGRAMSIVSNYETFSTPTGPGKPDYKTIYKYIAAVLNGVEPPKLSPLDSAIILDLMHSLADVLSSADTTTQRQVMQWKFSMLNCKVDINNLQDSAARVRKALTNVFPENFNIASSSKRTQTSDSTPTTPSHISTAGHSSNDSQATNNNVTQTPDFSQSSSSLETKTSYHSQPASNMMTKSPVVTQSSVNLPTTDSGSSSTNANLEADCPEVSGETTQCSHVPQRPSVAEPDVVPSRKRGQGRGRVRQGDPPLEKPQLFSLNPFCVPVEILKVSRTRRRERMQFKPL